MALFFRRDSVLPLPPLPVNLSLRIALAGVLWVASGWVASAQLTRLDSLTDFEAGSNGAALTPELLEAGTHGTGGSWSVTQEASPRLFVTNAFEAPFLCGVRVGSSFFGDTAGSRTYACNVPLAQQYISYHFTVRPARVSIGFFFRLSAFPNKGDSYDFAVFEGGGEFQSFNYDDSNSGGVFRNHTQFGATPTTDCTSNTTYWVTMLWDMNAGDAGQSTLMVYDAATWQLLGSNTMDHSSPQEAEDLHLGRFDNHTTEEDAESWAYYDDLIINLSGSVYPILPKCAQDLAPGISPVAGLSVGLNQIAGPIPFAVSDPETPASNLVVTVSSSDPALFPAGSLVLGGSDSSRTLTATPAAGRSGTATVTLRVSDGTQSSSTAFDLTVRSITAPGSYLLAEGFDAPGFDNTGWTVSGSPDPDYSGFVLDGGQSLRCVGAQTVSREFIMPGSFHLYGRVRWKIWSDFQRLFYWEDAGFSLAAAISAERGHLQARHGSASSVGRTLIVPEVTYHLWVDWTAGTLGAGTLRLFLSTTPSKPATPEGVITAGDGGAVARMQLGATADGPDVLFDRLLVSEQELDSNPGGSQAPTLSPIPDQVIPQDAAAGPLLFTVGDLETPADQLTVTATSSNPLLLPEAGMVLGGSGAKRSITLRPAPGRVGSATVTMQVSDGGQSARFPFGLTVLATNRAAAGVYADSFAPRVDGPVRVVLVQPDGAVVIGGLFQSVDGSPRPRLARLRADGFLDPEFNPGAAKPEAPELAAVHALARQADGGILVGGEFTALAGAPRDGLGRLNTDGTVDPGFNPAPGGRVQAMVIQPNGSIVVGGDFSVLAGQPRRSLGRLYPDGTLDAGFAPDLKGDVTSLLLNPDGTLIVAGTLFEADGLSVSNLVRLLPNGRLDPSFTAGTDDRVEALAGRRDGRILVGGRFGLLNGEVRLRLGQLLPSGGLDTNFIADSSGPVESLCLLGDGRMGGIL